MSFETSGNVTPVTRHHIPEAVLSHRAVRTWRYATLCKLRKLPSVHLQEDLQQTNLKAPGRSGYGLFELLRYLTSYRVKKRQTWVLTVRDLNLALSAYDVALRVSTESFADRICVDWPVTITDTWNSSHCEIYWSPSCDCHEHPASS
jgi:hypothetical protein